MAIELKAGQVVRTNWIPLPGKSTLIVEKTDNTLLSNEQMRAGRFLKLQKGRNKMRFINSVITQGRKVLGVTHTRATIYSKPEQFRLDKAGCLYSASGKKWVCVDYCSLRST